MAKLIKKNKFKQGGNIQYFLEGGIPEIQEIPEMLPGGEGNNSTPKQDYRTTFSKSITNSYIKNGQLLSRPLNMELFDRMYQLGKQQKIPYNTLMGMMASVAIESGGYEDARQINWSHKKGTPWTYLNNGGTGLIQWTGTAVPKNQIQAMFNDITTPYNSNTNYWGGKDVYRSGLHRGQYSPMDAAIHYRRYRVRPGVFNQQELINALNGFTKIYKPY